MKINESIILIKVGAPSKFDLINHLTNKGFQPMIMGESIKPSVERWGDRPPRSKPMIMGESPRQEVDIVFRQFASGLISTRQYEHRAKRLPRIKIFWSIVLKTSY